MDSLVDFDVDLESFKSAMITIEVFANIMPRF